MKNNKIAIEEIKKVIMDKLKERDDRKNKNYFLKYVSYLINTSIKDKELNVSSKEEKEKIINDVYLFFMNEYNK